MVLLLLLTGPTGLCTGKPDYMRDKNLVIIAPAAALEPNGARSSTGIANSSPRGTAKSAGRIYGIDCQVTYINGFFQVSPAINELP